MADTQLNAALPEDWMNHPQVRELLDKLAEMTALLDGFESKLGALAPKLEAARQSKETYIRSVNEQIKQYDGEIRELGALESEIKREMHKAAGLKSALQETLTSTIDGLEVTARLAIVEGRWQDIMDSNEWLWITAIKEFQMQAAQFAASCMERDLHGVLIADQMGLGKTLEATAAIDLVQGAEDYCEKMEQRLQGAVDPDSVQMHSVLWLCPNSIKSTTALEIAKWSDRQTVKLDGVPGVRGKIVDLAFDNGLTLIASYEQLRDRGKDANGNPKPVTPELMEKHWPIVILDEAHKFKNESSSTFGNVEKICQNAGMVIPMTGTPIMNRPGEFWAILHMLTLKGKYEGKFQDYWRFENEYLNVWGYSNQFKNGMYDRLINNVKDMVIRRRKDEVEIQLPDKVREVRFVELDAEQRSVYNDMRDKLFVWLDEQKSDFISATNLLAQLTRLRQIALLPSGVKIKRADGTEVTLECTESAKIDEAAEILEELLDNDEKCLVFSNYNEPLHETVRRVQALAKKLEKDIDVGMIIGGVKDTDRAIIQSRFNDPDDKLRVVVGNIAAMGLGLNLQGACSHAIFLDLGWNPGVNEQAEDRLHRTGQKSSVTIHIIQAEETVDAFIAMKLEEKANLIEGIIERSELRKALEEGLI